MLAQHGLARIRKSAQHSPARNPASTEFCAGAERSWAGLRCALGCAGAGLRWQILRWAALCAALRWRWAALALSCAGAGLRWEGPALELRWRWAALALASPAQPSTALATWPPPGEKLNSTQTTQHKRSVLSSRIPGEKLNSNKHKHKRSVLSSWIPGQKLKSTHTQEQSSPTIAPG